MSAKQTFSYILSDDQMRAQLASGATLRFQGLESEWQTVERQVERLGFGHLYFVSHTTGPNGGMTKVTPVREGREVGPA